MKMYLIALLVLFTGNGMAQKELGLPFKSIQQYNNTQQGTIQLQTNFGSPYFLNRKDIQKLKHKRIYHIDLVYTKFREKEDFDQLQLNQERIEQLKKFIPQIEEDQPNWTVFEQTGATERPVAKEYFHGFVIHYGDDISYKENQAYFENKGVPFGKIGIDNQKGGVVEYYTGSRIQMNKDAVYHQNGELVQGYYQLHYREFRNQADQVLSGIPMFYGNHPHGVFNSAGMYEIRAFKDGEELVLNDPAIINFQSTGYIDNLGFYELSEDGHWNEIGEITPESSSSNGGGNRRRPQYREMEVNRYNIEKGMVGSRMIFQKYVPEDEIDQGSYQGYSRIKVTEGIDRGQLKFALTEDDMIKYRKGMEGLDGPLREVCEVLDTQGVKNDILVFAKDSIYFLEYMTGYSFDDLQRSKEKSHTPNEPDYTVYKTKDFGYKLDSQLVAVETIKMPARTGLVWELRSNNFGVFNCDQTRRLERPMALRPTYYNKETDERIEDLYMAYVVDMEINSALSYPPNNIYCSSHKKAKVLIFTADDRVFLYNQADLARTNFALVNVDMACQEITDEVDTPEDLKRILGV